MGRPLVLLVLGGLLVAGVITRIHLLDRSLWLDEAWVANSIRAASLYQAIYYDDWLQTTPPLFIALSRLVTTVFGTSNIAFRTLPALSGIVSVLLFSFIALRLLKPSFAMIAILLFVFSPRVILYSQSLKQYSTDVLSTISLLVLGYLYIEKRADRWFNLLLAAFVALSFLSYPAMLFLPFLLCATMTKVDFQSKANDTQRASRANCRHFFWVVALAVFVFVTNYLLFIAPNKTSALTEFFPEGFYEGHTLADFLEFYSARLLTLTGIFFFGGSGVLRIVTVCITVIGFIHLWVSQTRWSRLETFQTAVLFSAPIAGIVGLNLLGFFPLPGFHQRILLFVFPITALAFCLGLQFLAGLASGFITSRWVSLKATSVENVLGSAVFVGLLGLVWVFFYSVGVKPFFAEEYEDTEEAIAYLAKRVQPNDVLYIYAAMREPFKLYGGMLLATRTFYGKVGMPCCPRKDYRSPRQESADDVIGEVSALRNAAAGRSLWLLVTDRPLHWFYLQRNDIEIIDRGIANQGCEKTGEAKFTGVYVGHFRCKPK